MKIDHFNSTIENVAVCYYSKLLHLKKLKLFIFLIFCLTCWIFPSTIYGQTDIFNWEKVAPENHGFSTEKLQAFKDSLAAKGTKKLLVIRHDKLVLDWYADGWQDHERKHYTASLAKAVVSGLSLILAMQDGLIHPDAPASRYIKPWKDDHLKSKISIRQLATHNSGIEDAEVSESARDSLIRQGLDTHMDIPGWKGQFWRKDPDPFSVSLKHAPVKFTPGTDYAYSNPGIAMLNYAVTASISDTEYPDIRSYLKNRIYKPLGINSDDYSMGYGKTYEINDLPLVPGWGGGSFTADALARIGRLMLHKGEWEGKQIINAEVVKEAVTYQETALPASRSAISPEWSNQSEVNPVPASTLGWYHNFDGIWKFLPRDTYCGAGAQGQILMVIPSLDLIMVRMGDQLYNESQGETSWEGREKHLFNPLMEALVDPPYPKSDFSMKFDPSSKVVRFAEGSDNWPITADKDETYYTAYGDGWGFKKDSDIKLSLGLSTVTGNPPNIEGKNLYTNSGERVGQGEYAPKASGMLMVDDTLYMLVRNSNNTQLGWSADKGNTWKWADWKFETSFGYPTFLNYGPDYMGARDEYVYIYSHDAPSAYKIADDMVMARVKKHQIKNREAYEFFSGFGISGDQVWEDDILKRKPVFSNPAKCYRSGISYNPGINRYMWVQTTPISEKGSRFEGSIGIFVSKEPWGPWETLYYSPEWDMGPGETASIPPFWLRDEGQSGYLLFSGDDAFSLRGFSIE